MTWPAPADPAAAARLLERFAALGPAEASAADGPARPMLEALGGGSPYLSDLAIREHRTVLDMLAHGPDATVGAAMAALAATPHTVPRAALNAALRAAKRQVALAAAIADIGAMWPLHAVTHALTALADGTLQLAVRHLLHAAHAAGQLRLPNPDQPDAGSGFTALGMGKLGAGELNYSSDVDLILLYDPGVYPEMDGLGATFTRLARNLVSIMESRDADGYVFRTDLRLRPDPAATPPAVSLPAAISYYESMGQNWERAAMVKARPVAGDLAMGHAFLQAIRPFVWRRALDFAAMSDIQATKRRINEHRGFEAGASLPGLDLKLAPGGIREVEFAAQTLQLVWGGRDPALRDPTTLGALRRLHRAGRLPRRTAAELTVAYKALRGTEHRLQMVGDRQTHSLPTKPDEFARFATFAGFATPDAFSQWLAAHMDRVCRGYAAVFGDLPDPPGATPMLDLSGPDEPPAAAEALRGMGFRNTGAVVASLRSWQSGRLRALRSTRARELMDAVLPVLLPALGAQPDPDAAFSRFDTLLSRLPAGVGLLSMMNRNPALVCRVAAVLGAAPSLADHLAQVPAALEGLLDGAAFGAAPDILQRRLSDARAAEDAVAITRTLVRAEEFRLCVAQMEGDVDVDEAGLFRTSLADAALGALLPRVMAEHAARNGTLRGGAVCIVALGKAGGREMMAGSDLDLMLVYHHPERVTESRGARAVPASQWFIRAAHAVVAALTAPGAEGPLYAVDMRLRPSGNKGPVAVSLRSFERYHAQDAWTWERMALTRARVVAGPPGLSARVERAITAAMRTPVPPGQTLADAAAMRARMLHDLSPAGPWDTKLRPGGAVEVEFIAQSLLLAHGLATGAHATRDALRLLGASGLLPEADALVAADRLWRTVQSMTRITVGRGASELPPAAAAALVRAAGAGHDLPSLRAAMDDTAALVRAAFTRHVGAVHDR